MVFGIRSFLVQHFYWLSAELREFSLESDPIDSSHVVTAIVFKEQVQIIDVSERGSLHWNLLDIICLRDLQRLGGGEVRSCREIEIIAVVKKFERVRA